MKNILILIFTFLLFTSCSKNQKKLKSIFETQNDTIVRVRHFDKEGRLTFDKTTQIIADWNNELMTWMTANYYKYGRKSTAYYAHSNSILFKTIYDYDYLGNLRDTFSIYPTRPKVRLRNHYKEIYSFNSSNQIKEFIEKKLPKEIVYSKTTEAESEHEYFYSEQTSTNGILTKQFWSVFDSVKYVSTIEKYDTRNNLIYEYHNQITKEYKYDNNNLLIEEIKKYSSNGGFQKKVFSYTNGKLIKTHLYHDQNLGFIYEYYYKDTLLIKRINKRITNSYGFANRKRKEVIEYKYEYY